MSLFLFSTFSYSGPARASICLTRRNRVAAKYLFAKVRLWTLDIFATRKFFALLPSSPSTRCRRNFSHTIEQPQATVTEPSELSRHDHRPSNHFKRSGRTRSVRRATDASLSVREPLSEALNYLTHASPPSAGLLWRLLRFPPSSLRSTS